MPKKVSNIMDEMLNDSEYNVTREMPKTEKLSELSDLLEKMDKAQDRIAKATEELSKANEDFAQYNNLLIPDLFDELGMKKFMLQDGRTVEVNLKYTASITEENSENCFSWLKDNGHEALIKHKVETDIKKGETKAHEALTKLLEKLGLLYKDKTYVHPQTLYSFVKEQIESGADFPKDLFKVYPLRSTKVK
jgi:chromosome condensin MukBEF ATPase and DNA-binding subunit MukB